MKHLFYSFANFVCVVVKKFTFGRKVQKKSRDSHHRTSISDLCECLLPLEAVNIV